MALSSVEGPVSAKLAEPTQQLGDLVRVASSNTAITTAQSQTVVTQGRIRVGSVDHPLRVRCQDSAPKVLEMAESATMSRAGDVNVMLGTYDDVGNIEGHPRLVLKDGPVPPQHGLPSSGSNGSRRDSLPSSELVTFGSWIWMDEI